MGEGIVNAQHLIVTKCLSDLYILSLSLCYSVAISLCIECMTALAQPPCVNGVVSRRVYKLGSGEESSRVFKLSHWPQHFFYYVDIEKYKLTGNRQCMRIEQ